MGLLVELEEYRREASKVRRSLSLVDNEGRVTTINLSESEVELVDPRAEKPLRAKLLPKHRRV